MTTGRPQLSDAFTALLAKAGNQIAQGSADEYIKATGRPVAYRTKDGRIVDLEGNPVQKTPDHIILRYPETVH